MVAITILSFVTMIIYGAFAGMKTSREGVQRITDRYREARLALSRITRDVQSVYLSKHVPIDESLQVVETAFVGQQGTPADRLDFNTFSHLRLDRNARESDQAEVSYFGSQDPERSGVWDLARRVNPFLDLDPEQGGRVQLLATDIDLFDVEYLDSLTNEWVETWDSRQALEQTDRLPLQLRVILVLNGGQRASAGRARGTIRVVTKIPVALNRPLTFATQ
ncbi:MAG: general secretion pathway protein GspJ [Polyangiaceae bacterium]|nr:general secretion pathway protein GspJ [Polyangiaceae bacterium]